MRLIQLIAGTAALLAVAACEKAEDRAVSNAAPQFDVQLCAVDHIESPTTLAPGGCIVSPSKTFVFVMQDSGALELHKMDADKLSAQVWSSSSKGKTPNAATASFQEDGNLVIYDGGKPIWDSHSPGKLGHYILLVTDKGNAMVKTDAGKTAWSAQFDAQVCSASLDSPAQLAMEGCIVSPSRNYVMIVEKAGELQVAQLSANGSRRAKIWSSGERLGIGGGDPFLALQTDGNLVLYKKGKPIWNSKSNSAAPGAYHLNLSDDGDLKLQRADGAVIWSSKTGNARA